MLLPSAGYDGVLLCQPVITKSLEHDLLARVRELNRPCGIVTG